FGLDRPLSAVTHAVSAGERRDFSPDWPRLLGAEVDTTRVEPLVAVELLRVVAGERFEKVLAGARPEEEQVRPDAAGAGLARCVHDRFELLRPVRDPREDCASV